jgi:hypothetical protein
VRYNLGARPLISMYFEFFEIAIILKVANFKDQVCSKSIHLSGALFRIRLFASLE